MSSGVVVLGGGGVGPRRRPSFPLPNSIEYLAAYPVFIRLLCFMQDYFS